MGLAWLAIWVVTLAVSAELAELHYLNESEMEGFGATLGFLGVMVLGPAGFAASLRIARLSQRRWPFLVGAAVTGVGTVTFILVAFTSPVEHFRREKSANRTPLGADTAALDAVLRSAPRAPLDGRAPEDRLLFIVGPDKKQGLIDTQGRIVLEPEFDWTSDTSEGLAMVGREGRSGFVDGTGREVIAPAWGHAWSFSEGLAVVETAVDIPRRTFWRDFGFGDQTHERSKYGYIDRAGNVVIAPRFASARSFRGGVAWVDEGLGPGAEKWGLIDRTGRYLVEPRFQVEPAGFSEGLCPVWLGETWSVDESVEKFGYIDTSGNHVIPPRFRAAGSFAEGLAAVVTGGKLGFIDRAGALVIPTQFDWGSVNLNTRLPMFSEGLAPVIVQGRYGYIDRAGRIAIEPRYDRPEEFGSMSPDREMTFREGLAAVLVDGKIGFIDKTGRMLIAPQFRRVDPFEDGLARVEVRAGDWGYVRRDGAFLWHPLLAREE